MGSYYLSMQGGGEDIWGSIQRSSPYDPRISPGTPGDVPAKPFQFSCQRQPAKPRTGMSIFKHFFQTKLKHFDFDLISLWTCTVFTICQFGSDVASLKGKGQLPVHSNLHSLWRWQISLFFRSFHWPTLVRLKGLFLHVRCVPQQTSPWQFWTSVWLMLDLSRWHEPFGEHLSR